MQDLRIESVDHLQRGSVNIYAANCGEDRAVIAASLYAFEKYDAVETMVAELHDRPEFCQLAAAVHGLHLAKSDATPTTEAIAILTKLCDSRQPEAIRTRAGNLLIDIADDDRAVCDASSADDHVERFASCPRSIACTPDGCKAGGGNWPRCPKPDERPGQDAGEALVGVECYVHWKRVDERTAHVIETPPTKMIVDEYSCDGYVGIYRSKAGSLEGWSTGNVAYRATPKATP